MLIFDRAHESAALYIANLVLLYSYEHKFLKNASLTFD